jgi:hypothetical protein
MPTEAMFHVYEASPQRAGARRSSTYDEGSMRARLVRVRGGFPIPSPAQIDELGRIAIRRFLELSPERLASPRLDLAQALCCRRRSAQLLGSPSSEPEMSSTLYEGIISR